MTEKTNEVGHIVAVKAIFPSKEIAELMANLLETLVNDVQGPGQTTERVTFMTFEV